MLEPENLKDDFVVARDQEITSLRVWTLSLLTVDDVLYEGITFVENAYD